MNSTPIRMTEADLPVFPGWKIRNHDEYLKAAPNIWGLNAGASAFQLENETSDRVRGFSAPAGQFVDLKIDRGSDGAVNWRETLICPITGMNNRVRAVFHLFMSEYMHREDASVFLTEQTTALYRHVHRCFPQTIGSEYLPNLVPGTVTDEGIRHEDLTRLTFQPNQFDAILTLDVLEHVPDYADALRECVRVLKPGGRMYISVPFTQQADTIVRARVGSDGAIEHLMEPEYHGDTIGSGSILCYYHFGYDLLDHMRSAGLSDAYVILYNSVELGYLGVLQHIFVGVR